MKGKALIDKHVLVLLNESLDMLHGRLKGDLAYRLLQKESGKNKANISGLKKKINELEQQIGHNEGLINEK